VLTDGTNNVSSYTIFGINSTLRELRPGHLVRHDRVAHHHHRHLHRAESVISFFMLIGCTDTGTYDITAATELSRTGGRGRKGRAGGYQYESSSPS
jgi:hypothetical protein